MNRILSIAAAALFVGGCLILAAAPSAAFADTQLPLTSSTNLITDFTAQDIHYGDSVHYQFIQGTYAGGTVHSNGTFSLTLGNFGCPTSGPLICDGGSLALWTVSSAVGYYAFSWQDLTTSAPIVYQEWYWDGSSGHDTLPPSDTTTRIVTVVPVASSTVATTTTTGGTIFVNPADYQDGMEFTMQFVNQTVNTSLSYSALDAWNAATGRGVQTYTFPITSSGSSSFATTTTFAFGGKWFATYQITSPTFLSSIPFIGGYFNPASEAATTTSFVVGALTQLDQAIAIGQTAVASYAVYGVNATNTAVEIYCNPLSTDGKFSIVSCLGILIIPSSSDLLNVWNALYAAVLQRAPWGYLTRFFTIMSSTATTTLPVINIETPLGRPGSPEYTDGSFHFDPNDMLAGGATLLNTVHTSFGGDLDVQQVFEPFVDLTIALAVLMAIIHDLLGLSKHRHARPHSLH